MMVLCGDGIWRDAEKLAAAKSHEEAYPEQYAHELVGKVMRWSGGRSGTVRRVLLSTKYGDLAEFEELRGTFYRISDLTEVTP